MNCGIGTSCSYLLALNPTTHPSCQGSWRTREHVEGVRSQVPGSGSRTSHMICVSVMLDLFLITHALLLGPVQRFKKGLEILWGLSFMEAPLLVSSQTYRSFVSDALSTAYLPWMTKHRQMVDSAVTAVSVWRTIMDQLQGVFASLIPFLLTMCLLTRTS